MNDLFETARKKININLIHTFFNSDGSYSKAGEYYLLSPLRGDNHVKSFHINEATGQWFDHATNEGGDFIDLVSRANGINLKDAAECIIKESGGVYIKPDNNEKKKDIKKYAAPVLPIPDTAEMKKSIMDRVRQSWCVDTWGKAETINRYFNERGEWQFCVCRFVKEKKTGDKKRDKVDILFYYGDNGKWWSKWHSNLKPFPLFGIHNIKENKLPVLIVEGEKCGRVEVPGFNVISWLGGTANMKNSDWRPLRKRDVYIWPDADSAMDKNNEFFLPRESQPGIKAAHYIKSIIPGSKILEIYKHKPIEDLPGGWDLADYIEEGGDPVKFIKEFTPYNSISVEIDPYHVYKKFIDDFYDFDSLEQANGGFWQYNNNDHFWRKIIKNDIFCNLQRWLEETGLQWTITAKLKATKFINEVKQYIDRHSLGYLSKNPFKDSAVAPYIHMQNGAIKIQKDSIEWLPRGKYEESYFKGLYPINCLDFDFDYKNYKKIIAADSCPAFYFFIKELIPKNYMDNLSKEKKEDVIKETFNFITQIIAYSLSPIKPNEYFFGIYGGQRTGKSFFLKIIKSIVGSEFCVEKKISDMDNRFASSGLWGKKVFIEPDLKTRKPLPEDFIKAYAGEQEITIEEKNMSAIDGVKTSIAMFFISNYEFHTKGLEGLARRMIMIPYKNEIKKHDTRLLDKILGEYKHGRESGKMKGKAFDERPAILALAMQAWNNFCENDFIMQVPEWISTEKDTWLIKTNSVVCFIEETYMQLVNESLVTRSDMYDNYKEWCKDEGKKPLGKMNFYEEIRRDKRIESMKSGGYDNFIIRPPKEFDDDIPF